MASTAWTYAHRAVSMSRKSTERVMRMSETIERLTKARDAVLDACTCTLDHGDMVTLTDIVVKLTVIINREQDRIMWQRIERVST